MFVGFEGLGLAAHLSQRAPTRDAPTWVLGYGGVRWYRAVGGSRAPLTTMGTGSESGKTREALSPEATETTPHLQPEPIAPYCVTHSTPFSNSRLNPALWLSTA